MLFYSLHVVRATGVDTYILMQSHAECIMQAQAHPKSTSANSRESLWVKPQPSPSTFQENSLEILNVLCLAEGPPELSLSCL